MLGYRDPLPHVPHRVLIAGVTGAGKSTLGRRLAQHWSLPYQEMDLLHWGPNWTTRPSFADDVAELAAQDRWITEWQYWSNGNKHLLGDRADTCVWLNLSRPVARWRLVRRTIARNFVGREPFPGCVEPPVWTAFTDPDHILRWEMHTHHKWRERMPHLEREFPNLTIVELASPRQVREWLKSRSREA